MKAEELNGTHLGYQVRVTGSHVKAEGVLLGVSHKADKIEDTPLAASGFFYPPALGRSWVELEFSSGSIKVEPHASVEVRTD